jgi:arylsulfatase A-like enzyme
VLVKAPGIEPRRASEPVTVLQVAPTIAKLLGIDPPPAATEPPLPLRPAAPR